MDFVGDVASVPGLVRVGPETFGIIDEVLVDVAGQALSGPLEHPTYWLKADEESESLAGVGHFVDWLLENKATHSARIVTIGGGVIPDVVTLACHIYNRGVMWTFGPTTLLSRADSCIGANLPAGRSLTHDIAPPSRGGADDEAWRWAAEAAATQVRHALPRAKPIFHTAAGRGWSGPVRTTGAEDLVRAHVAAIAAPYIDEAANVGFRAMGGLVCSGGVAERFAARACRNPVGGFNRLAKIVAEADMALAGLAVLAGRM